MAPQDDELSLREARECGSTAHIFSRHFFYLEANEYIWYMRESSPKSITFQIVRPIYSATNSKLSANHDANSKTIFYVTLTLFLHN